MYNFGVQGWRYIGIYPRLIRGCKKTFLHPLYILCYLIASSSFATIRRDLSILESQGKVLRTHGGVILRKTAETEIPLILREEQNNKSKKIIAEKAASYIQNGDVIFMDASSTASYLIPYLKNFRDIIVITNSPKNSLRLGSENIKKLLHRRSFACALCRLCR